jgi:hypothetical protein
MFRYFELFDVCANLFGFPRIPATGVGRTCRWGWGTGSAGTIGHKPWDMGIRVGNFGASREVAHPHAHFRGTASNGAGVSGPARAGSPDDKKQAETGPPPTATGSPRHAVRDAVREVDVNPRHPDLKFDKLTSSGHLLLQLAQVT